MGENTVEFACFVRETGEKESLFGKNKEGKPLQSGAVCGIVSDV